MVSRNITLEKSQRLEHLPFRYTNSLMQSPVRYSMMERRTLYKLSEEIKKRFSEMGLSVRENWKNLIFKLTNKDLAIIGGDKNINHTYEVIYELSEKAILQYYENKKGQLVLAYFHWIDGFQYNTDTNDYSIRVSPELFDYVVNLTQKFTTLDLNVALRLKSKYSQKFYELGCMFDSGQQFFEQTAPHRALKNRVVQMSVETVRYILGLTELRDPKTRKIVYKEKYHRYEQLRRFVIEQAQAELYGLYREKKCNVWFDYLPCERSGRGRNGGAPKKIFFFFYTNDFPKSLIEEEDHPYKIGDTPLVPFKEETKVLKDKKPDAKPAASIIKDKKSAYSPSTWIAMGAETCRMLVKALLDEYLHPMEVEYYLMHIDREQRNCPDSYSQVMQVIHEKLHQTKFEKGSPSYKHKCLVDNAFQKNLKEYGWSIPPMNHKGK